MVGPALTDAGAIDPSTSARQHTTNRSGFDITL
jgi:hypothetical protein